MWFYFGNPVGESGNSTTDARVTSADETGARSHPRTLADPAPITYRWDYDRDKRVDATDQMLARQHATKVETALRLISIRPPAPTALAATPASVSQINLDWADNAEMGITYNVYRGTTEDFIPDPSNQIATGVSGSAYADTTVAAATRYYYQVTAVNLAGESAASDVATNVTGFNLQPTDLTSTMVDENAIELLWNDTSANETGYTVEFYTSGVWTAIQQLGPNTTYAFVDALTPETEYSFRVTANFSAGGGAVSLQQTAPTTTQATAPVGQRHSLVLAIHGHKHTMRSSAASAGIRDIVNRLRNPDPQANMNYRVYLTSEWDFSSPGINWDGTGPLLDRALARLQRGDIMEVAVIGYSHGASIARRVIERLSNARNPLQDLWNVTYSAYIDAIERGPIDHWPLVVAETRRPQFTGTVPHRHDNFFQTSNIDVFYNPMRGAAVPGADANYAFTDPSYNHYNIDGDEPGVKSVIIREIRTRVRM